MHRVVYCTSLLPSYCLSCLLWYTSDGHPLGIYVFSFVMLQVTNLFKDSAMNSFITFYCFQFHWFFLVLFSSFCLLWFYSALLTFTWKLRSSSYFPLGTTLGGSFRKGRLVDGWGMLAQQMEILRWKRRESKEAPVSCPLMSHDGGGRCHWASTVLGS